MSLTKGMIIDYLNNVNSLKDINNHDVHHNKNKTGQTPLTIQIGILYIDKLLVKNSAQEEDSDSMEHERSALVNLREALDNLPSGFTGLLSLLTQDLDDIQKNLFESINTYLDSILDVEKHKFLIKAVVLVLKIIEYDLGKKSGPITVGPSFWPTVILSNEQRIKNHTQVQQLLTGIISKFEMYYEEELDTKFGTPEVS